MRSIVRSAAPQNRDRYEVSILGGPGSAAHHAPPDDAAHRRSGVLRSIRGTMPRCFSSTRVGLKADSGWQ
jgi:hypothetical protein